jgi:hypothetical protein
MVGEQVEGMSAMRMVIRMTRSVQWGVECDGNVGDDLGVGAVLKHSLVDKGWIFHGTRAKRCHHHGLVDV